MFSRSFKGVGLHYTAFRDAIREDSRQTTPSRGVSPRKKFAVKANVESRVKKAIEKKFTISVSNLTGANDYFIDGLYNGVGEKYSISVGVSNIEEFLPSLALNPGMAKLAVSGLPAGLKYDAANGKITGVATKSGTYTVTLTVTDGKAKYVSTITVEIKSLPNWVVGMFEGCFNESGWYNYSNWVAD